MNFVPQTSAFTFGSQSPSPAPSFGGFGQSAPAPAADTQQNGTPSMFGGGQSVGPSFGSTFSAAPTPTQQNGFGFGTQSTQPSQQTNNTSFSGFGATQQNGVTPTSATFGSFDKPQEPAQNGTGSMFNLGGAQQETPKSNNPFASFQFNAPKPNEPAQPSIPSIGGFPSSQPQETQNKSNGLFSFGQKPHEGTDKPASNAFAGFGQKPQENGNSTAGFGQTHTETSKPNNLFAGIGQSEKPIFTMPSAYGDKEKSTLQQTPKTALFGQAQQNGEKPAESQPPKTSLFSGNFGQTSSTTSQIEQTTAKPSPAGLFGASMSTSQAEQTTSKPSTSGLFGAGTPSQAPQANGEPKGLFGASTTSFAPIKPGGSVFDTAPKTSSNLKFNFSSADPSQVYNDKEDKDADDREGDQPSGTNAFGASQQSIFNASQGQAPSSSSMFGGGAQTQSSSSLFKPNASQQDTSMTTPGTTSQKNMFAQQATTGTPGSTTAAAPAAPRSIMDRITNPMPQSDNAPETPATQKPLFAPSMTSVTPSLFQSAQPSQHSGETPKPKSLFERMDQPAPSQPKDNPSKAKNLFERSEQPAPQQPLTPAPPSAPSHAFNVPATAPAARTIPPQQARPSAVTASTAAVRNVPAAQVQKFKELNEGMLAHLRSQDITKDWTTTFDYYVKTAAEIRATQPPAPRAGTFIAPQTQQNASSTPQSNIFEAQTLRSTAPTNTFGAETPKASTSTCAFSKPPSSAPPAAKKRPHEDDDSTQPPATEKRSKPNEPQYPSLSENASSSAKLFASALDGSKKAPAPKPAQTSGFNPSTSLFSSTAKTTTTTSAPAAVKPTTGFTPSFGAAPSGGGSFLSAFGSKAKAAEDDAKKRRMDEDYDSDEETKEQWEARDREKQEAKRKEIEAAAKAGAGFMFGGTSTNKAADATAGEKAQGAGNNTWKPETPIKFGASTSGLLSTTPAVPPPKFGNGLFGATSTPAAATQEAGKLAPPSTGFSFGPKASSLNASRATTPGVTTDGEASNAGEAKDDGDEQNDPQADDMTSLLPEEREANEIVLELPHIVTKIFEKVDDDSPKPSWISKGEGKAYVLKEKLSGKTRILQKVGVNQLALNFNPMKGMKYELHPKKDTMVIGTFFDHIHSKPGKLLRFFLTADSADEAKELARVLTEGIPK